MRYNQSFTTAVAKALIATSVHFFADVNISTNLGITSLQQLVIIFNLAPCLSILLEYYIFLTHEKLVCKSRKHDSG